MRLETKRLVIRPFTTGDLDEIYRLVYADSTVKSAWSGQTGTESQIKAAFARRHVDCADSFCYRAVLRKDDEQLLGLMGFQRYHPDEDLGWLVFEHGPPVGWRRPDLIEVELTYALGSAYWGQGYATEAGQAVIAHGFDQMSIARIVTGTLASNLRSIALMQRLGFVVQRNLNPDLACDDDGAQAVVGILENRRLLASEGILMDWAARSLESEIAYSVALGGTATEYADFVHVHNEAVPWGGDFNCTLGVRMSDLASFDCIVEQVEELHVQHHLERPNRYDVYPPALEQERWQPELLERGFRTHTSIWFCAPTVESELPPGFYLVEPGEDEFVAWYHARHCDQAWYDGDYARQILPLQRRFVRHFRIYWLRREGKLVGWVYCGSLGDYGSLFDVWIEPQHRGQGLGRVLMNAIRAEGARQGLEWLLLRTSESRRGFYERCGFQECLRSSVIRLQG